MSGKLIFHFGTVNSAKTAQLLLMIHNYTECNWKVITIKPSVDTRSSYIETRANIPSRKPDICISPDESLYDYTSIINSADVIFVDECQFLTVDQVNELRRISIVRDIDVLCFGLRTDSNTHLFDASKRLFELSDEISEVKTICSICGKHASFNKKVSNVNSNDTIDPGWDNFSQVCYKHFIERVD